MRELAKRLRRQFVDFAGAAVEPREQRWERAAEGQDQAENDQRGNDDEGRQPVAKPPRRRRLSSSKSSRVTPADRVAVLR
jgi:hypothetical protein